MVTLGRGLGSEVVACVRSVRVDSPRMSAPVHAGLVDAIAAVAPSVVALAKALHADPEVAREEVRSSRACAALLADAGFDVVWGAGELHTAFRATLDSGRPGPRVAILGEYDALPGLGHGCGHNLIAGASVGAGLALARMGIAAGAVEVYGCPAEEIGFGKPAMIRAGMFEGITHALAFHGAPFCGPLRSCRAMRARTYTFRGAPGHAGIAPWEGRNALDACVAFYGAMAPLRQHAMDGERVHGIIVDGGDAWNVVPERAAARMGIRAATGERADHLIARVDEAARGAALMHGCEVEISDAESMQPFTFDGSMADLVTRHLGAAGHVPGEPIPIGASTDVGDVSELVPTGMFFAPSWPEGTAFHSQEAVDASGSSQGYAVMVDAARVLAAATRELVSDAD